MTQTPVGGAVDDQRHSQIDWEAVERSPEFRELIQRKKAFVIPATLFFLAWYFGFVILAGYAPDFMGREFLTDGLTVGYVLALSQFVMTWVLGWMYLRRADRDFDPLAVKAREAALRTGADPGGDGRFTRGAVADEAPTGAQANPEVPRQ
jgi:uncharacterized membrane protein (DUF485 family)